MLCHANHLSPVECRRPRRGDTAYDHLSIENAIGMNNVSYFPNLTMKYGVQTLSVQFFLNISFHNTLSPIKESENTLGSNLHEHVVLGQINKNKCRSISHSRTKSLSTALWLMWQTLVLVDTSTSSTQNGVRSSGQRCLEWHTRREWERQGSSN